MTLLDRFLHYLPPLYRQWFDAAFGQTPQSFVLVPVVEKNDAFARVGKIECSCRIFGD